jgi:uncharacterized protein (DUF1330 family)
MKTNHKIVLATLAGAALGVIGTVSIHARQAKAPAGYVIAEVDVHDPATFQEYSKQAPGTVAKYNGHYVIRGGKTKALEGDAPKRFVVIAFDSVEKAEAWEDSPEYSAIKPIRHKSATSRVFIAEGVPAQ